MSKKPTDKNDNPFPEFSGELNLPENIDRRTFLIRNAVIGAAAAMTGTVWTSQARAQQAAKDAEEKPPFLYEMKEKPDQSYSVKLGDKTFNLSLNDIIYDTPKGEFPHPNTMTCKLMGGDKPVYELEYYSPGGGFYEWRGYTPPKKGAPKYPYATMKALRQHAEKNNLSIAQTIMANEIAISGKTEEQINAFLDNMANDMGATGT